MTITKEQEGLTMTKAVIAILLLPVMLFAALCFSRAANAQEEIKLCVDGKQVQTDVPAYIKSGRTMVPLRFIAEAFGFKVVWAGEDLYPGKLYQKRVDDNSVNLSAVVLVQSLSTNRPIVNNVTVDFYLDGRYVGRAKQEIVMNNDFSGSYGASAAITVPWPKNETHTVKVVVDPEKAHWDSNRGNNVLEKNVTLND